MKLLKKEYPAFYFRQSDKSPVQCSFVATSADVSDWASVPVKTSSDLKNFQRPEIESHVNEIDEFFSKFKENCSPSSIVVGFKNNVSCVNEENNHLELDNIKVGEVIKGKILIDYIDPMIEDHNEKIQLLTGLVEELKITLADEIRKISENIKSNNLYTIDENEDEVINEFNEEDEVINEFNEEDEVINEFNENDLLKAKKSFMESLVNLNIQELNKEELEDWFFKLLDLNKAGLIIDGQHRVKGTKKSNVLFNITAIPNATWPELAFQFIVLNKSAKKVPDSLLINIVGNSLNEEELNSIEKRLNDSGIQVPLYQGVMKIHEDPESPFYRKLKFGIEDENGIIDASAAKTKIVNYWFKCTMYELIEHLLKGKSKKEKIQYWISSGLWYEYLKVFWNAAKDFYSNNSTLWDDNLEKDGKTPASKLMRVTIINLTQQAIIKHIQTSLFAEIKNDITGKKTMNDLLPNIEKFEEFAKFYFNRLIPEFFTEWSKTNAKGFDGSKAIKDAYVDAVTLIIEDRHTVADLKGKIKHLLFRN